MERAEEPANESYRCESVWIIIKLDQSSARRIEILLYELFKNGCNIMQQLNFEFSSSRNF